MVHPRDLLRIDSNDRASQFSAPIENLSSNTVDCGISVFPCLNRWCNLERFAKAGVLLYFLTQIAINQGILAVYVQATSIIWKRQHGISDNLLEWLLKSSDILCGLTALCITYWANRIHRVSWLGGLAVLQSVIGLVLIIPEIYYPFSGSVFPEETTSLCTLDSSNNNNLTGTEEIKRQFNEVALGVFLIHQLFSGFGNIALYALSISYLDDNVNVTNSPIFIAVLLASREVGKQIGMYLTWTVVSHNSSKVFVSPVFLSISVVLFFNATIAAMFPKTLPSILLKKAVASILGSAEREEETEEVDGFFKSIWRILKNKILLLNILASTFVFSAVINYDLMRAIFYESFFYLPSTSFDLSGYNDPWLSQITTNILKQPFIALTMVITGFFMSKIKPRARTLALWNIKAIALALIVYGTVVFYNCEKSLQTEMNDRITTPFCSSRCHCSEKIPFSPVCTENSQVTYFSPCHAGCTTIREVNSLKIFGNCSCGDNVFTTVHTDATLGSCNNNCHIFWSVSQAHGILAAGVLATTVVVSFMISLRSVKAIDKCIALGLHITFVGIIPYIPFRLIYLTFADIFCDYKTSNGLCRLHSHSFGIFHISATCLLLILAIILYILLAVFVGKLNLYVDPESNKAENKVNDEEIEELETQRDDFSRDELFRTSSPSTTDNQDLRLKDFSPEPGVIKEEDESGENNSTTHPPPTETNQLLATEPERFDFTLATVHSPGTQSGPVDDNDDSSKTLQNGRTKKVLESNL